MSRFCILRLLRTQSAKNTIFAFPKTFTIFYLSIYYFKVKITLILTLIMVILGNAEIADWVLSKSIHLGPLCWSLTSLRPGF